MMVFEVPARRFLMILSRCSFIQHVSFGSILVSFWGLFFGDLVGRKIKCRQKSMRKLPSKKVAFEEARLSKILFAEARMGVRREVSFLY